MARHRLPSVELDADPAVHDELVPEVAGGERGGGGGGRAGPVGDRRKDAKTQRPVDSQPLCVFPSLRLPTGAYSAVDTAGRLRRSAPRTPSPSRNRPPGCRG